MFESVVISIIRQAAMLTKPQQEAFTGHAAEAMATLINSSETEIDNEIARSIALPLSRQVLEKLQALI